jgi:methyl-accepting chemotaxis protein
MLAQLASICQVDADNLPSTTDTLWRGVLLVVVLLTIYLLAGLALAHNRSLDYLSTALERIASGNLSEGTAVRARLHAAKSETDRILGALAQMCANLVQSVNQVRAGADHIANGSHQIAAGYTDLSQRTEEQRHARGNGAAWRTFRHGGRTAQLSRSRRRAEKRGTYRGGGEFRAASPAP